MRLRHHLRQSNLRYDRDGALFLCVARRPGEEISLLSRPQLLPCHHTLQAQLILTCTQALIHVIRSHHGLSGNVSLNVPFQRSPMTKYLYSRPRFGPNTTIGTANVARAASRQPWSLWPTLASRQPVLIFRAWSTAILS